MPFRDHAKGGNHLGLGAYPWVAPMHGLTSQHMGAIELPIDDPIQQHLPVGLGLQSYIEPLILEATFS